MSPENELQNCYSEDLQEYFQPSTSPFTPFVYISFFQKKAGRRKVLFILAKKIINSHIKRAFFLNILAKPFVQVEKQERSNFYLIKGVDGKLLGLT